MGAKRKRRSRTKSTPRKSKGWYWDQVRAFESGLIRDALSESQGNVSAAAESLELNRLTLLRKVERLGLKKLTRGRGRGLVAG